jgi:hypothetical protein
VSLAFPNLLSIGSCSLRDDAESARRVALKQTGSLGKSLMPSRHDPLCGERRTDVHLIEHFPIQRLAPAAPLPWGADTPCSPCDLATPDFSRGSSFSPRTIRAAVLALFAAAGKPVAAFDVHLCKIVLLRQRPRISVPGATATLLRT